MPCSRPEKVYSLRMDLADAIDHCQLLFLKSLSARERQALDSTKK